MFMVLNLTLSIIAYVIDVAYTSIITDFSNKGNYRTFKYQLLQTSSSFASIIFIPLGTIYFGKIGFESLVIISSLLIGISGLFILTIILFDKEKILSRKKILIKKSIDLETISKG